MSQDPYRGIDTHAEIADLRRQLSWAEQREEHEARERVRLENEKQARWSEYTELRGALREARGRAITSWWVGLIIGLGAGIMLGHWLFTTA